MNRDKRTAWLATGLMAASALASRFGDPDGGRTAFIHTGADIVFTTIMGFLIVGALSSLGFLVYYYMKRAPSAEAPEVEENEIEIMESSRYEQILAELQGIHLNLQSKGGRSNFVKIQRLVRIFLSKLGLHDAQEMDDTDLITAIRASNLNPKDQQVLCSVIERCSRGERLEEAEWNFKPLELVRDFKRVVLQIEGKQER